MRFKSYWFGVLLMLLPFAAASPASANAVWIDGKPIFLSDIDRRQRRIEQRRPRPRPRPPASRQPVYPKHASGGPQPAITAEAPKIVSLPQPEKPGTVIIDQQDRKLFYVLTEELAYLYPISFGRDGFRCTGEKKISAIR